MTEKTTTPFIYKFILPQGFMDLFDVHECEEAKGKLTIVLKVKSNKSVEDKNIEPKGFFGLKEPPIPK